MPFNIFFNSASSVNPLSINSGLEPSCTRSEACNRYEPDWSNGGRFAGSRDTLADDAEFAGNVWYTRSVIELCVNEWPDR